MTDHDFLPEALQKADLIVSGFELFFFQGPAISTYLNVEEFKGRDIAIRLVTCFLTFGN